MTTHVNVIYYKSTGAEPEQLLRHLAAHARDAKIADDVSPVEAELLWPRGPGNEDAVTIRLRCVQTRLSSGGHLPIENLVADEAQYEDDGQRLYSRDFEALERADAIVFVVDDQAHRFKRYVRNLEILRADLRATGRVPEDVPVVFQLNHTVADMSDEEAFVEIVSTRSVADPVVRKRIVATTPSDLIRALTWPRCDYVEAFPRRKLGAKQALDRAIELHEEMAAQRRPGGQS